jgi:hypothetical protein
LCVCVCVCVCFHPCVHACLCVFLASVVGPWLWDILSGTLVVEHSKANCNVP